MRRALLVLAAVLATTRFTQAQTLAPDSGSRVRIQFAEESSAETGTLRALTRDSLSYSPGPSSAHLTVPLARVRSLDVSGGSQRSTKVMLLGTGIGALAGVGAFASFVASSNREGGDGGPGLGVGLIIFAPLFVLGGAAGGFLIGMQHYEEHWTRVYPPPRDVSLLVGPTARGGLEIGLSIPFGGPEASEMLIDSTLLAATSTP